ncbi:MAG: hypothetical protein E6H70_01110, partial [Betaproteobacteria bacterium]
MDDLAHALLPQGFWRPFLVAAGIYGIRYALLAGTAFLVWYARPAEGKLQRAMPRRAQIRREIAYSAVAVLIFGLVIAAISGYGIAPYTLVYLDVARYGWGYFWLSILIGRPGARPGADHVHHSPASVGAARFPHDLDCDQRIRTSGIRGLPEWMAATPAGALDQYFG